MAEFCAECLRFELGAPEEENDFAVTCPCCIGKQPNGWQWVLCEGCGPIPVDARGHRVRADSPHDDVSHWPKDA